MWKNDLQILKKWPWQVENGFSGPRGEKRRVELQMNGAKPLALNISHKWTRAAFLCLFVFQRSWILMLVDIKFRDVPRHLKNGFPKVHFFGFTSSIHGLYLLENSKAPSPNTTKAKLVREWISIAISKVCWEMCHIHWEGLNSITSTWRTINQVPLETVPICTCLPWCSSLISYREGMWLSS